jgi:hypothetical protein
MDDIEPLVEEQLDGTLLIGEPDEDFTPEEPGLREFDENLATNMDEKELQELASEQRQLFDEDEESRSNWLFNYEQGLKSVLNEDVDDESSRTDRKLTDVSHPLIAEAATQFQARAIGELFPAAGPVGANIIGEPNEQRMEQASRVRNYMNYQIMEAMPEYFPDMDQMLLHLPLAGHTFKKSYFDVNLRRVTSRFVQAADFIVDNDAVDLDTADRYTQVLRIQRHDYDTYVRNDFYLAIPEDTVIATTENSEQLPKILEGREETISSDDGEVVLLEMHVYLDVESNGDEGHKPYILTIHRDSDTVVGLRRNWDEGDENFRKAVWFISYKFLPGLGFYGYGLYHIIGGLGKAATGALRSLLDAAAYANMQGGFKLRGRVRGGEIEIVPGEFADIEAAVDDINKAIMPLPFKEPSATMMSLLAFVVETGKRFANTTEINISDANQNTPVGTTVALLEENARVFSAIHKRLHDSQKREFKLIAKLNGIYLPEKYPYQVKEKDQFILREDFNERIDIIPTSDPSTFSSTQRIAQAQQMLQLAQLAPQHHNIYAALKRMYQATRTPNFEEVLIDPTDIERLDPISENVFMMNNKPVKAFIDQDHMAHMTVLDDWFSRLPEQGQQLYLQGYISHRAEHMALYYRTQMQSQLGAPLPTLPDFRDPNDKVQPIDSDSDQKISEAAALVIQQQQQQQQQQQPIGPPVPTGAGGKQEDESMNVAKQLAEVEAMSIQKKTEADVQAKMAKAQVDVQIKQMQAQADMQIAQIQEQAKAQAVVMREQLKSETDQKKIAAEIKTIYAKADADIKIAAEKSRANIENMRAELQVKLAVENKKASAQVHDTRVKAAASMASDAVKTNAGIENDRRKTESSREP